MANKFFSKIDNGIRKAIRGLGNSIVKLSTIKIVFAEEKPEPKQDKDAKKD